MSKEYQGVQYAVAITPSDSATFDQPRAIWIGGAGSGNLTVKWANGTTTAYAGVTVGRMLIEPIGIMATGTDVTAIHAEY